MKVQENSVAVTKSWGLTLDGWAVALALFAALLVRLGVFKHVPW